MTYANVASFISTIIIVDDSHAHIRGYSILGREFKLKEQEPRLDEGRHLDGKVFKDKFFVVDRAEYLRVVPEAMRSELSAEVYIPIYVAKRSFRPKYL
jgi:hypothetical protein